MSQPSSPVGLVLSFSVSGQLLSESIKTQASVGSSVASENYCHQSGRSNRQLEGGNAFYFKVGLSAWKGHSNSKTPGWAPVGKGGG